MGLEQLFGAMRHRNDHIQKLRENPPATIKDLRTKLVEVLDTKPFAVGTAIKCVKKPYSQNFPEVGEVVVVVEQRPRQFLPNDDGSPITAGEFGDISIARPAQGLPEGFGLWATHSGYFVEASDEDIAAAEAKSLEDYNSTLAKIQSEDED